MLPTVPNVIGRCQVDGMALTTRRGGGANRTERPAVARHPSQDRTAGTAVQRASNDTEMYAQVTPHALRLSSSE